MEKTTYKKTKGKTIRKPQKQKKKTHTLWQRDVTKIYKNIQKKERKESTKEKENRQAGEKRRGEVVQQKSENQVKKIKEVHREPAFTGQSRKKENTTRRAGEGNFQTPSPTNKMTSKNQRGAQLH